MFSSSRHIIVCPNDESHFLKIFCFEKKDDDIISGLFFCKKCNEIYPIIDGIPRFLQFDCLDYNDILEWGEFYRTLKDRKCNEKQRSLLAGKLHRAGLSDDDEISKKAKSFWDSKYSNSQYHSAFCVDDAGNVVGNRRYIRDKIIFRQIREGINGKVLVDVGCGRAIDVYQLLDPASYKYGYIGIDISVAALREARKHITGNFIQANIEKLPLRMVSADYILVLGALHHLPTGEKVLYDLYKILKPKGILAYHEVVKHINFSYNPYRKREIPNHVPIIENEANRINGMYASIIAYKREYSPIRTLFVKIFESLMNRNLILTRLVLLIDDIAINLSQFFEIMNASSVIAVMRKK